VSDDFELEVESDETSKAATSTTNDDEDDEGSDGDDLTVQECRTMVFTGAEVEVCVCGVVMCDDCVVCGARQMLMASRTPTIYGDSSAVEIVET
jgi:hypothetical protein